MLTKQQVVQDYAPIPTAQQRREVLHAGAQRVRQIVIDWLVERGVKRPKRTTVEAEAKMLNRLSERCGYLADAQLVTLREAWFELAGLCKGCWPSEATLVGQAHGIAMPPLEYSVKVLSYMQSMAGADALEKDEAVELLDWLLRNPGVPGQGTNGSIIRQRISDAAEERRRERGHLRDAVARGVANDHHIARLRQIESAQIEARNIILACENHPVGTSCRPKDGVASQEQEVA